MLLKTHEDIFPDFLLAIMYMKRSGIREFSHYVFETTRVNCLEPVSRWQASHCEASTPPRIAMASCRCRAWQRQPPNKGWACARTGLVWDDRPCRGSTRSWGTPLRATLSARYTSSQMPFACRMCRTTLFRNKRFFALCILVPPDSDIIAAFCDQFHSSRFFSTSVDCGPPVPQAPRCRSSERYFHAPRRSPPAAAAATRPSLHCQCRAPRCWPTRKCRPRR